jgi:hypothetical protein
VSDVKPIPDTYPRMSPHLSIAGAAAAIDYYKSIFGATERMRMAMPDGTVAHAELQLGGSVIVIGDEVAGGTDPAPRRSAARRWRCSCTSRTSTMFSSEPSQRGRSPFRSPRTTSTATAWRCSTIRSGIGGISQRTSRTSPPTRWSGVPPRSLAAVDAFAGSPRIETRKLMPFDTHDLPEVQALGVQSRR